MPDKDMALLQALFARILRSKSPVITVSLEELLSDMGRRPSGLESDVAAALSALSGIGLLFHHGDGHSCAVVSCLEMAETDGTAEATLYSRYAEELLKENPSLDPESYLPVPEGSIGPICP